MDNDEYRHLLRTLKDVLRAKKLTYAKLAKTLGVSEVTVKRWFSGHPCTLATIFRICETLQISFLDVAALARREEEVDCVLTEKQERFFAEHPALFGVLKLLQRGVPAAELARRWKLNSARLHQALRKLETHGFLEVLAHGKVRMKIAGNIRYSHKGPLARKILRPQIERFLDQVDRILEQDDVCMHSAELELAESSIAEMVEEIHALGAKYRARAVREKSLVAPNKLRSVRWLLGFAPYETDWSQYPLRD